MQWVYAVFGLVMVGASLLMVVLAFDGAKFESRWSIAGFGAFVALFFGLGVLVAWPIVAAVGDLLWGTDTARVIVRGREAAAVEDVAARYQALRVVVDVTAMAGALAAPFLWWGMRAREPESRRHWAVLAVGLLGGTVAFIHYAAPAALAWFRGCPSVGSLRVFLDRHELLTVMTLYWELLWLGVLASSTWTGLVAGPWTAFLSPVPLLPWWVGYYSGFSFWAQALCWLGVVVLGVVFKVIQSAERDRELATRAQRAHNLSRRLLTVDYDRRPPFALYLRRFSSTGTLDTQEISEKADPLDLETVLSQAFRPELHLVGLNRADAGAIVGADYLFGADTEWQATFRRLAAAATLIVMLPPDRGSTLDEIAWLADNRMLGKTLFLMPETITGTGVQAWVSLPSTGFKVTETRWLDHAPEWAAARAAVKERTGLQLPDYRPDGALFTMNAASRQLQRLEPLALARSVFKVSRLRRAVKVVSRAPARSTAVITSSGVLHSLASGIRRLTSR